VLVSVVLLGATLVFAQDEEVVYHACVKNSGAMFMVSGPEDCKGNETYIWWNQIGPQGPVGPQGPEGPSGLVNLNYVKTSQVIPPGGAAGAKAQCDSGDEVISGGYTMSPWGSGVFFYTLANHPNELEQSWQASGNNQSGFEITLTVTAICLDVIP